MKTKSLLFKLFAIVLALSCAVGANAASRLRGDVTDNGEVDISDVTALIDYVLTGDASSLNLSGADCTLNGEIDISDVTGLIDYILKGEWPDEPSVTPGEYVDLGLPSGTLWATRNVGAISPEESGCHYAWGEIEAVQDYYEPGIFGHNYKWGKNTSDGFKYTKYCTISSYGYNGFVDGKTELDPEDDAAYVYWGPLWRMPSLAQLQELCENCSWQFTQLNGVNGSLVTGPNGNTMFLPAAGCYLWPDMNANYGYVGDYWSRSLVADYPSSAHNMYTNDLYFECGSDGRSYGKSVRPVRVSQK